MHSMRPLTSTVLFCLILLLPGCDLGTRYIFNASQDLRGTPEDVNLVYEDVRVVSADGVDLHGWYVPADSSMPLVCFFHGNAANISHRIENIAYLHAMGFPVFIFDYRGFGSSQGQPLHEVDLYEDGRGVLAWLRQHGWSPERTIYYGRSLGGAVALQMALEQPPAGLVLEAPFTSLRQIARRHAPVSYYLFGVWAIGSKFDNIGKIKDLNAPLLVFHGSRDAIVPLHMSQDLIGQAPEPKRLVEVTGAGHSDAYVAGGELYRSAWLEFAAALKDFRAGVKVSSGGVATLTASPTPSPLTYGLEGEGQ